MNQTKLRAMLRALGVADVSAATEPGGSAPAVAANVAGFTSESAETGKRKKPRRDGGKKAKKQDKGKKDGVRASGKKADQRRPVRPDAPIATTWAPAAPKGPTGPTGPGGGTGPTGPTGPKGPTGPIATPVISAVTAGGNLIAYNGSLTDAEADSFKECDSSFPTFRTFPAATCPPGTVPVSCGYDIQIDGTTGPTWIIGEFQPPLSSLGVSGQDCVLTLMSDGYCSALTDPPTLIPVVTTAVCMSPVTLG